ncbi:MAG: hypothetical protein K2N48_01165, partial [Muribaculaceae bacterium]|nr:hypothetical protein [Muribaculaceae bacterium]
MSKKKRNKSALRKIKEDLAKNVSKYEYSFDASDEDKLSQIRQNTENACANMVRQLIATGGITIHPDKLSIHINSDNIDALQLLPFIPMGSKIEYPSEKKWVVIQNGRRIGKGMYKEKETGGPDERGQLSFGVRTDFEFHER